MDEDIQELGQTRRSQNDAAGRERELFWAMGTMMKALRAEWDISTLPQQRDTGGSGWANVETGSSVLGAMGPVRG